MQKGENVVGPGSPGDAALSHTSAQQIADFLATELRALDEVHEHPHVRHHRRIHHARLVQDDAFEAQFGGARQFDGQRVAARVGWLGRLGRSRRTVAQLT